MGTFPWPSCTLRRIDPTEVSGKVFAIDSSDGVIEHRNGGVIHISRGIGVSNDGEEIKDLSLEVFYPEGGRALREYRSLSRENIEHSVAIKCLEECNGNSFLLIDGSLYGRMLHVPEELPIRGEFPLIIEYIEIPRADFQGLEVGSHLGGCQQGL